MELLLTVNHVRILYLTTIRILGDILRPHFSNRNPSKQLTLLPHLWLSIQIRILLSFSNPSCYLSLYPGFRIQTRLGVSGQVDDIVESLSKVSVGTGLSHGA